MIRVVVHPYHSRTKPARLQMAMEVVGAIIGQPFYHDMRTRQQLGYVVFADVRQCEPGGARVLDLVIQSSAADPPDLSRRAIHFAESFLATLEALPDEQFRDHFDALIRGRQYSERTLAEEVCRHWAEISSGVPAFDRSAHESAALAALTKMDVVETYRDLIMPGADRRVFTTEIYAATAAARPDDAPPPGSVPVHPTRHEFIAANTLFPPVSTMEIQSTLSGTSRAFVLAA